MNPPHGLRRHAIASCVLAGLGLLFALYAAFGHAALSTSGAKLLPDLLLELVLPSAAVLVVGMPAARRRQWAEVRVCGHCWASLALLVLTLIVITADAWRTL